MSLSDRFAAIKAVGVSTEEDDTDTEDELLQRLLGNKKRFTWSDPAKISFTSTRDGFPAHNDDSGDGESSGCDDCEDVVDPSWIKNFESIIQKQNEAKDPSSQTKVYSVLKMPDTDILLHSLKRTIDMYNSTLQDVSKKNGIHHMLNEKQNTVCKSSEVSKEQEHTDTRDAELHKMHNIELKSDNFNNLTTVTDQHISEKKKDFEAFVEQNVANINGTNLSNQTECWSKSQFRHAERQQEISPNKSLKDDLNKDSKNIFSKSTDSVEGMKAAVSADSSPVADLNCFGEKVIMIHKQKIDSKQVKKLTNPDHESPKCKKRIVEKKMYIHEGVHKKSISVSKDVSSTKFNPETVSSNKNVEKQLNTDRLRHTSKLGSTNIALKHGEKRKPATSIKPDINSRELPENKKSCSQVLESGGKHAKSSYINILETTNLTSTNKSMPTKDDTILSNETEAKTMKTAILVKSNSETSVENNISKNVLPSDKSVEFKKSKTFNINHCLSFPLDELLPVKKRRVSDDSSLVNSSKTPRKRHTSEMCVNQYHTNQNTDFWQPSSVVAVSPLIPVNSNIFHGTVYVNPDEYPTSKGQPCYRNDSPLIGACASATPDQEEITVHKTFASQNLAYILSEVESGNQSVLSLIQEALNKEIGSNLEALASKAQQNRDPRLAKTPNSLEDSMGSFGFYTERNTRRYENIQAKEKGDNAGVEQSSELFRLFVEQCSALVKTDEDRDKLQSLVKVLKSESGDGLTGTGFTPPDTDMAVEYAPSDIGMQIGYTSPNSKLGNFCNLSNLETNHDLDNMVSGHSPENSLCSSVSLDYKTEQFEGRTMLKGGVKPRHIPKTTVRKNGKMSPKDPRSKTYTARRICASLPLPEFIKVLWGKNEACQKLSDSENENIKLKEAKLSVYVPPKQNMKQEKTKKMTEKKNEDTFHVSKNYNRNAKTEYGKHSTVTSPTRENYIINIGTPVMDEHDVKICQSVTSDDSFISKNGKCQLPQLTHYDMKRCHSNLKIDAEHDSPSKLAEEKGKHKSGTVDYNLKKSSTIIEHSIDTSIRPLSVQENKKIPVLIRSNSWTDYPETDPKFRHTILRNVDLKETNSHAEQVNPQTSSKLLVPCVKYDEPSKSTNNSSISSLVSLSSGTKTEENIGIDCVFQDSKVESSRSNIEKQQIKTNRQNNDSFTKSEKIEVSCKKKEVNIQKENAVNKVSKTSARKLSAHEKSENDVPLFEKLQLSLSEISQSEFEDGQLLETIVTKEVEHKNKDFQISNKRKHKHYKSRKRHSSSSSEESRTSSRSKNKYESSSNKHKSSGSGNKYKSDKQKSKHMSDACTLKDLKNSKDRVRHHTTKGDFYKSEKRCSDGYDQGKRRHSHGEDSRRKKDHGHDSQRKKGHREDSYRLKDHEEDSYRQQDLGKDNNQQKECYPSDSKIVNLKQSQSKMKITMTVEKGYRPLKYDSLSTISNCDNYSRDIAVIPSRHFRNIEASPLKLSSSETNNTDSSTFEKPEYLECSVSNDIALNKKHKQKFCTIKKTSHKSYVPYKKDKVKINLELQKDKEFLEMFKQKITSAKEKTTHSPDKEAESVGMSSESEKKRKSCEQKNV